MKNALLTLTALVLFSSCRKEKTVLATMPDQNIGTLSATMNGEPWQATFTRLVSQSANGRVSIAAHVYINGIEAMILDFQTLALTTRRQPISTFGHYYDIGNSASKDTCYATLYTVDGDILYDAYFGIADGSTDDHLDIDIYNPSTGFLKGSFQLDLVRYDKHGPSQTSLPEILRFRNGSFNLTLPKD